MTEPSFAPPPAARVLLPAGTRGTLEHLQFDKRIVLGVERYRLSERLEALLPGEDMVKFHVRLSGGRLLRFDRHEPIVLPAVATAVLLHERDLPKVDCVLADQDETAVTVAMPRERFAEYLDLSDCPVPASLERMMTRYARAPRIAVTAPTRGEIELVRAITDCSRTGGVRRLYLEAKALELMHTVIEHLSAPAESRTPTLRLTGRDRKVLTEVRALLESSVMDTARIDELSRQFGLNRNKLCTGFRQLFGISIFDFASGVKMEEARRLLRESDLSMLQIALSVGYSSARAFSTAFHRHFGRRPRELRTGHLPAGS